MTTIEEMLGIEASSNYNDSELLVNDTSEWMSLWSDEDDLLSSLPREEGGGAGMCLVLFVFVSAVYGSVRYGSLRRLGNTSHVAPGFLKKTTWDGCYVPNSVRCRRFARELCHQCILPFVAHSDPSGISQFGHDAYTRTSLLK